MSSLLKRQLFLSLGLGSVPFLTTGVATRFRPLKMTFHVFCNIITYWGAEQTFARVTEIHYPPTSVVNKWPIAQPNPLRTA